MLWRLRPREVPAQRVVQLTTLAGDEWWPSLSSDGTQVAFSWTGEKLGNPSIYLTMFGSTEVRRLTTSADAAPRQVTTDPGDENVPNWSRDGRWIYFASTREGPRDTWRVPAVGGTPERMTRGGSYLNAQESMDGTELLYQRWDGKPAPMVQGPLMAHPLRGGRPRQLLQCVADGGFRVVQDGVYYVECVENPNGWTEKVVLRLLDAPSGADRVVATLQLPVNLFNLTVSPGGSTVLYSREVGKFGDLMMIEHFR